MKLLNIISNYVYPSIRKKLVEILYYEKKFKQKEIARKLYITQSAVSRYIRGSRGRYLDITKATETMKELKELAEIIAKSDLEPEELEYRLATIVFKAMGRGEICQFHSQIENIDPKTCTLCRELFGSYLLGLEERNKN